MPATPTLDDRIDRLYAGPAESFVAARDALAKELKAGGEKDGAAVVKALRKPTTAASAVNRLAHGARRELAKLLAVGDDLRAAHEALSDGGGDAGIRRATAKRRKLVDDLADRAIALLGDSGEAQREAIATTLDAAVLDAEAAEMVRQGRLTKELPPASFFGAGATQPGPQPSPAAKPSATSRREERRAARAAAAATTSGPAPTAPSQPAPAPRPATDVAAVRAEADRRAAEAQQAARDASAARQEVSRLQDLLVTANAKSKQADERARLTQWASSTAQQALRDASDGQ